MNRYPTPRRCGQGPQYDDVDMESASESDVESDLEMMNPNASERIATLDKRSIRARYSRL